MNDSLLSWLAVGCTVIGLVLLFLAREPQVTEQTIAGTVVEKQGSLVFVQTILPVRARNVTVGEVFNRTVFWDGVQFVALNQNRP